MQYRTLLYLSDVNCRHFTEQSSCANEGGHAANLILLVTGSMHRVFIYYNNENSHCGNNFSHNFRNNNYVMKIKIVLHHFYKKVVFDYYKQGNIVSTACQCAMKVIGSEQMSIELLC